jgi:hypothetical protein
MRSAPVAGNGVACESRGMARCRWIAVSVLLPVLYAAVVFVVTRKPKPIYAFAEPTVVTVTE